VINFPVLNCTSRIPNTVLLHHEDIKEDTSAGNEATLSPYGKRDILQQMISFVGPNQYRFVAAVRQDFKAAHLQLFPNNKQTYINVLTVKHVKIYLKECEDAYQSTKLCNAATQHGNLSVLAYLRSLNCRWDHHTCSKAAQFGHLHILQYLRGNGCPWD
jgi:hypothetical protein